MRHQAKYAYSVRYNFNQLLALPAQKAFDWCTDYRPSDIRLMKEQGTRRIRRITDDTLLLTESMPRKDKTITKSKLVRLNGPELSWTSTHIAGPNLHSQFLYKLVPEGKSYSRLYFRGLYVCYSSKPISNAQLRRIANEERRGDSTAWRHLAAAVRREKSTH